MTPFVAEYITRKRLKRLGFVSSYDNLPHIKSDIFVIIDAHLEKIREEDAEKARSKRK